MQFMLHIIRSATVAYQHLLEKFLHLLINLVLMCRDAYLKNAHNSLDAYHLKISRYLPYLRPSRPQALSGNQQSTRFNPYGKQKKKAKGRGRGAYQQGGYYQVQVPPPQ